MSCDNPNISSYSYLTYNSNNYLVFKHINTKPIQRFHRQIREADSEWCRSADPHVQHLNQSKNLAVGEVTVIVKQLSYILFDLQ